MSIVFDRAVEYYDQTRAVPQALLDAMIDALARETRLTRASRALEIGIGTGRIAIAVAGRLERLFGIDLSRDMMAVLRRKIEGTNLQIALTEGNALYLPYPNDTFDLAYAVHVYHLVANWREAMADARRVIKPGGSFVVSFHRRDDDSPNVRLRDEMRRLAREYGVDTRRPGAQSEDETLGEIQNMYGNARVVLVAAQREPEVPSEILTDLDKQIFSETWAIPREVMDRVTPRLREWAAQEYGDLAQPIEALNETRWLIAEKR